MNAQEAMDRMTEAQLIAVAECSNELRASGQGVVWHFNSCGCCVAVHENVAEGQCPPFGFVVGRDGGVSTYVDA